MSTARAGTAGAADASVGSRRALYATWVYWSPFVVGAVLVVSVVVIAVLLGRDNM